MDRLACHLFKPWNCLIIKRHWFELRGVTALMTTSKSASGGLWPFGNSRKLAPSFLFVPIYLSASRCCGHCVVFLHNSPWLHKPQYSLAFASSKTRKYILGLLVSFLFSVFCLGRGIECVSICVVIRTCGRPGIATRHGFENHIHDIYASFPTKK